MSWLGSLAIYLALYVALVGVTMGIIAARTGSRRFLHATRFATYTTFGAISVASMVLIHALLTHDFSIKYVAAFSDQSMPTFYLLGAFWGGQAGSLLFWIWKVTLFTAICVYTNRKSYQDFMPWVMAVSLAVAAGLLVILVFGSNPFEGYHLIDDPTQGKGLNPLLQTPKMVLHPPALLTGMASMTVPFAFAIAALLSGNLSNAWVEAARKWILWPWLFLSIGNILGGMWAYEELGWGGYWAWDPVENAALLPWLTSTALIHSLLIQERRGMLKRWNVGLMIGTFLLTIFGTYITRSGLIESVHSFAQSDIGPYFLNLLLTVTVLSIALFIYRWKALQSEQRLDSPVSREAAFIFNNWMFLSMTAVVLFGTLWPRIKEGLTGQDIAMGPQWFNRWMIPLGLLMMLMMGIGTIIAWRRANWKNFQRNFVIPIATALILTPLSVGLYWMVRGQGLVSPNSLDASYAIIAIALCFFVGATIVQEFSRGISARRRMHDESFGESLYRLCMKQKRRYGGYIVHLGVVFAFVAFAGNAMKIEKDVSLAQGESMQIGDYSFTYKSLSDQHNRERVLYSASVQVARDGRPLYEMHPGKSIFHSSPNMPVSEIDIRSTPLEDVYVALVNYDPDGRRAAFKIFVSPFTWWFWFGGIILVLGTLICLWPTRESLESLRPGAGGLGRAAIFGGVVMIVFSPMLVWTVESHTSWGDARRMEQAPVAALIDGPSDVSPAQPEPS
ncbi:heme lyase CcmF/NrfE family subunit [Lujinxingia sediminis]|uniref:Heme lyase CcmF/NrfE family subunit n=1 Tax=Lujinxingia sediminis TaxID=2480984 RepID=A0ABY0CWD8_9DELT|nr:heme lyase CcmF/NrfE family subunit [Lujinxingia sediminis]RVU47998.1 heme lyase CcmF/NrfE family subunit [Lujinxingia sediminis]